MNRILKVKQIKNIAKNCIEYEVIEATNTVVYKIGEILSEAQVEGLCREAGTNVKIVSK